MNKPIDTSTLAGKISVMQAAERGEAVERRWRPSSVWMAQESKFADWNWGLFDYRIAPREPREFVVWAHHGGATLCSSDMTIHGWEKIKVREVLE